MRVQADAKERKIRFTLSPDMVEGLLQLYTQKKTTKLQRWMIPTLHLQFTALADRGMPAVFVTLAPLLLESYASIPYCYRLVLRPGRHGFRYTVPAKYIGVRLDIKSKRLRTLWVRNPDGLMFIFDDEDMAVLYRADQEKPKAAE